MFKIMNKKIDLLLATNNLTWQNLANNINMEIETLNTNFCPFHIRFYKKGESLETEGSFSGKTGGIHPPCAAAEW